ncbi:DUF5703 family protein [Spongisporangium articulatum]|uniref:DUF5703 family protein n=1 Tax=Spongisporangium articulatum TaxID=3362603 RepID=A0ABW8ASS2_9ACTN
MSDLEREPARRGQQPRSGADYEYRLVVMPRGTTRAEARKVLTDHAEYGRWELARVQLMFGGARKVWLRRRIIRVTRSA